MKRLVLPLFILLGISVQAKDIDLKKYGAKADGKTNVTVVLQKAIDEVSKAGGGRVTISGGTFLITPVELKSGVELFIDADAVLLGSGDLADYPDREAPRHVVTENLPRWRNIALIYADEASNIAISGRGTIDCNGKCFVRTKKDQNWTGWQYERIAPRRESMPRAVFFAGCSDVSVTDVTMVNQPAGWSYWVHDCDRVRFDGCKILADVHYPNNDGIHINCSRDVTVSNCIIETGDDSIVIRANSRSLKENKACERVVITNCVLRSWSSGIRFGWTNDGVMRNCTISNVVMHDCSNAVTFFLSSVEHTLTTNDYGREATKLENISFSNIQMYQIYGSPIFFKAGPTEKDLFDQVRNVSFANVQCRSLNDCYFSRRVGGTSGISFTDCNFELASPTEFPGDSKRHGYFLAPKDGKDDGYRVCAFVWPSCHDDSLGRMNWEQGIGEWEVIKKGNPRFAGHYQPKQPLWGYEMDNDPQVVEKWIQTALKYGVNTFVYDWYWFDHYPYLESALNDGFLKAPSNGMMQFFIMWANHDVKHNYWNYHKWGSDDSLLWDGAIDPADWPKIAKRIITQYFTRPNYTKIDGKPVFAIFSAGNFIKSFGNAEAAKEAMDYLRAEAVKAGFPGLHYMMMNGGGPSFNEKSIKNTENAMCLGPDSWAWYNMGGFDTDYLVHCSKASELRSKWDQHMDIPLFPTVSIGWDDSPRFPAKGEKDVTRWNHTPEVFQTYLREAKDYADSHNQPKFVFINAWNEWVEGSYLLPDKLTGYGYLDAVRNVFRPWQTK